VPKATLRDVGGRSGCSITTVAQVLNDVTGKRIPESTRQRVRAAAEFAQQPAGASGGIACSRRLVDAYRYLCRCRGG
jgi:LacI family transcriptional regulator